MRIPPLPQPKQVLDLATPEGCNAELSYSTWKWTGWELNQRPVNRKSNALPLSHHASHVHVAQWSVYPNLCGNTATEQDTDCSVCCSLLITSLIHLHFNGYNALQTFFLLTHLLKHLADGHFLGKRQLPPRVVETEVVFFSDTPYNILQMPSVSK